MSVIQITIDSFQKFELKLGKFSPLIYMVFSSLCFALMGLSVKFARTIPPFQIIYTRGFLSIIFSFFIINLRKYELFSKDNKTNKLLIMRGIMGGLGLSLYFHSLFILPLSIISVLQRITPLWVGIFGALLYKEPYKLIHIITTIISFVGILLIFKPEFLFGSGYHNENKERFDEYFLGLCLILLNTVLGSFIILTIRELRNRSNVIVLVFYFNLFTLIFGGVGEFYETSKVLNVHEWFVVGLMTCFGLGGQLLGARALFLEKAFIVCICEYLNVVFSQCFDIFILDEYFDFLAYLGIFVIMISMVTLIYSEKK